MKRKKTSPCEDEVLFWIGHSLSDPQIAKKFRITRGMVDSQTTDLFDTENLPTVTLSHDVPSQFCNSCTQGIFSLYQLIGEHE